MVPDWLKEEQRVLAKLQGQRVGFRFGKTDQTLPPSQHVGRVSDELAILADELSRKTVTSNQKAAWAIKKAEERMVGGSLISWLSNPETGGKALQKAVGWELVTCIVFAEYFPNKDFNPNYPYLVLVYREWAFMGVGVELGFIFCKTIYQVWSPAEIMTVNFPRRKSIFR